MRMENVLEYGINDEIVIDGKDWVFNYKPGDDIIYVKGSYLKPLTNDRDDYEVDYKQIQGLIQYYLEKYFKVDTSNLDEYWLMFME